jgi:hypothetical protein
MNMAENSFLVKKIEKNNKLKMYQIFFKTFVSTLKPFEIGPTEIPNKETNFRGVTFLPDPSFEY